MAALLCFGNVPGGRTHGDSRDSRRGVNNSGERGSGGGNVRLNLSRPPHSCDFDEYYYYQQQQQQQSRQQQRHPVDTLKVIYY